MVVVGMVDDLLVLSSKEKLVLLFLAGIPLWWVAPPGVGLLYLIFIPIAVSICSNLTNMLAGLNGIESGLGVIAMTSLTISCLILGKYDVTIISMAMMNVVYLRNYVSNYLSIDICLEKTFYNEGILNFIRFDQYRRICKDKKFIVWCAIRKYS